MAMAQTLAPHAQTKIFDVGISFLSYLPRAFYRPGASLQNNVFFPLPCFFLVRSSLHHKMLPCCYNLKRPSAIVIMDSNANDVCYIVAHVRIYIFKFVTITAWMVNSCSVMYPMNRVYSCGHIIVRRISHETYNRNGE